MGKSAELFNKAWSPHIIALNLEKIAFSEALGPKQIPECADQIDPCMKILLGWAMSVFFIGRCYRRAWS